MDAKVAKQRLQDDDNTNSMKAAGALGPPIFKGIVVYTDGMLHIPEIEARRLVLKYGGRKEAYKTPLVTHVVANQLSEATAGPLRELKRKNQNPYFVVRSEWITDCVDAGKILSEEAYSPACMNIQVPGQRGLFSGVKRVLIRNKPSSRSSGAPKSTPLQSTSAPSSKEATSKVPLLESALSSKTSEEDPCFVTNFFRNSRLHHIGSFRKHLRGLTKRLRRQRTSRNVQSSSSTATTPYIARRVIAHIDMDCFFASVALLRRPDLRDKPVAVTHASKTSDSAEISSCNYIARAFGVRNGSWMGNARKLCPNLEVVPYEFSEYTRISEIVYTIIFDYTAEVQAMSCDEAYADFTEVVIQRQSLRPSTTASFEAIIKSLMEEIRKRVLEATGCTASVGIGRNKLLAKLATSYAKQLYGPDNQFSLLHEDVATETKRVHDFISALPVSKMPGLGWRRLKLIPHVQTCAELREWSEYQLQELFGEGFGTTLYQSLRGIAPSELETSMDPKSVGAEINYGCRFRTEKRYREVMKDLAAEVCNRMSNSDSVGTVVTLKIMRTKNVEKESEKYLGHGRCTKISKSERLPNYVFEEEAIFKQVMKLWDAMSFPVNEIRGIGIQIGSIVCRSDAKQDQSLTVMWNKHQQKKDLLSGQVTCEESKGTSIAPIVIDLASVDGQADRHLLTADSVDCLPSRDGKSGDDLSFARKMQAEEEQNFRARMAQEKRDSEIAQRLAGGVPSIVGEGAKRKHSPGKVIMHGRIEQRPKQRKIFDFVPPTRNRRAEMGLNMGLSQAVDEDTFQELPRGLRLELLQETKRHNPPSLTCDPLDSNFSSSDTPPLSLATATQVQMYSDVSAFFEAENHPELGVIGSSLEWNMTCRQNLKSWLERHPEPSQAQIAALCQCCRFCITSRRIPLLVSLLKSCHTMVFSSETLNAESRRFWERGFYLTLWCVQACMKKHHGGGVLPLQDILLHADKSNKSKLRFLAEIT
jgi:nucleotidyltransferase/DNA polymerase involved in DNA repair